MAITMIYNRLQSIYNDLQSTTMVITMINNQLQSIYNHLHPITTHLQ